MDESFFAWALTVLAAGGMGVLSAVAWLRMRGGWPRRDDSPQRRAAAPGPVIGGYASVPMDCGWVNCECAPEVLMPTVYDKVVVVVLMDVGGEGRPDWRPALRCRACGRVYLPEEMVERAKGIAGKPRGGPGVAGRGIEPR